MISAFAINVAKKLDEFKREISPAARCAMEGSKSARYFKMDELKMGCFIQPKADKGSQKWIQILVNQRTDKINNKIKIGLALPDNETIEWLSPLEDKNYVEYKDADFLIKLGIDPEKVKLFEFWPKSGPRWDALAKSSSGKLFLVEAKSHIPELISICRANKKSMPLIKKSLDATKRRFGVRSSYDWTKPFYQYANRLAHANWLNTKGYDTRLVNVYFLNDKEMQGPSTIDEWKCAIRLLHRCLGLRENLIQKWIIDVFIDVNELK